MRLELSLRDATCLQVVELKQRTDYTLLTFETDNDNNTRFYTDTRMIMNLILVVLASKSDTNSIPPGECGEGKKNVKLSLCLTN
jgi:hypothetical protein